jgi:hypothetical protein
MAVDQGVSCGFTRAYKHDENPPQDLIMEHVIKEVMNSISEWFDFDEGPQ